MAEQTGVLTFKGESDPFIAEVHEMERAMHAALDKIESDLRRLNKIEDINTDKAEAEFDQLASAIDGTADKAEADFKRMRSASSTFFTDFRTLIAGIGLKRLTEDIITTAAAFERLELRLGTQNFTFAKDEAERLGFEIIGLGRSYDQFQKSTATAGISLQEQQRIFSAFGNAIASVGGTTEDLEGAVKAVTQIFNKSTVSAEELRGQLGDRLPGALNFAAEAMGLVGDATGTATQKLLKMVEEGELLATDLVPKMATVLENRLHPVLDSTQQNLVRVTNALDLAKSSFASGFLTEFNNGLAVTRQEMAGMEEEFRILGQVVAGTGKLFTGLSQLLVNSVGAAIGFVVERLALVNAGILELIAKSADLVPGLDNAARGLRKLADESRDTADTARIFAEDVAQDAIDAWDRVATAYDNVGAAAAEARSEVESFSNELGGTIEVSEKFAEIAAAAVGKVRDEYVGLVEAAEDARRAIASTKEVDKAKKSLDGLRAEQKKLQTQANLTTEEMNRLDEISREISEAEDELSSATAEYTANLQAQQAAQAAAVDGQQAANNIISEARAAVKGLIKENEELGTTVQREIEAAIREYEFFQSTTGASTQAVGLLESRIQQALQKAGERATASKEQQEGEKEAVEETTTAVEEQAAALDELKTKTEEAATTGETLVENQVELRDTAKEVSEVILESTQAAIEEQKLYNVELQKTVALCKELLECLRELAAA